MTSPAERDHLRLAILGSGYMGSTYAECLTKYDRRCRLVAISGGKRAPKLASDHGVAHVPTYEELLDRADVDVIVIATPPGLHKEQTEAAAAKKKHVLVEKPMAVSVRECDDMIRACKGASVYLEVLQTQRFRGAFTRAKKLIDEGQIGRIRMVKGTSLFTSYDEAGQPWLSDPKHGGAMLDLCVHCFDMMMHLTGGKPTRVFSTVTTFGKHPLPDYSSMTQVVFSNGVMGQQWASVEVVPPSLPDSRFSFTVVGDSGILDIDGYGKLMLGTGDRWETLWTMPPIDYVNNPFDPVRLKSFSGALQAFIDDILDHRPPTVPGEAGRAAVQFVEAAKRSSETGMAVDIPLG